MIATIHQPDFLPWLGFFERWKHSDLFIVLDDVQFLRQGWHNRDKIKTINGVKWITVPVLKKGAYYQEIKDVEIDNSHNWRNKHLKLIHASYKKASNFEHIFFQLSKIYMKNYNKLIDLNMDLLRFCASEFKINTPVVFASNFNIKATGNYKLIELLKKLKNKKYLTGTGSRAYLNETLFNKENIEVCWQEFIHPVYNQLHAEFVENISAIDYLMMNK